MSSTKCLPGCTCRKHLGGERSSETKQKISDTLRGHEISTETRQKISSALTGKMTGVKRSDEVRQRQSVAKFGVPTSHGLAHHESYQRWYNMMNRCHWNPTRWHGQRGISVCDEWWNVTTFIAYLDENLGPCPENYSIDRIDNNGNYCPGNVRWATKSQQSSNQNRRRMS